MNRRCFMEVDVPDGAQGIRWQSSRTMRWVTRTWQRPLERGGFLGHPKRVPCSTTRVQYLGSWPGRWEELSLREARIR